MEEEKSYIAQSVDQIKMFSNGTYRYVLRIGEMKFYSEPMDEESFIRAWDGLLQRPELHTVQYGKDDGRWYGF